MWSVDCRAAWRGFQEGGHWNRKTTPSELWEDTWSWEGAWVQGRTDRTCVSLDVSIDRGGHQEFYHLFMQKIFIEPLTCPKYSHSRFCGHGSEQERESLTSGTLYLSPAFRWLGGAQCLKRGNSWGEAAWWADREPGTLLGAGALDVHVEMLMRKHEMQSGAHREIDPRRTRPLYSSLWSYVTASAFLICTCTLKDFLQTEDMPPLNIEREQAEKESCQDWELAHFVLYLWSL